MIAIRGLSKAFGRRRVLQHIDLDVSPGEIVALVGPNGAGKTTLLEVLATVILPDSGEARVCGHDIAVDPMSVKRLVGYCPSSPALYPQLTGHQNLEFFAALHGLSGEAAVRGALALVGLEGERRLEVQRYSDGMRQRLSLARVLMTHPRVLLLDEPTRSLDHASAQHLRAVLRRLAEHEGTSVLLVSHNDVEAATACDRVALLRDGTIAAAGEPGRVLREAGWNLS